MAKGYVGKAETLQDGSIKASVLFPKERIGEVFPMAYQEVDMILWSEMPADTDKVAELIRLRDSAERMEAVIGQLKEQIEKTLQPKYIVSSATFMEPEAAIEVAHEPPGL